MSTLKNSRAVFFDKSSTYRTFGDLSTLNNSRSGALNNSRDAASRRSQAHEFIEIFSFLRFSPCIQRISCISTLVVGRRAAVNSAVCKGLLRFLGASPPPAPTGRKRPSARAFGAPRPASPRGYAPRATRSPSIEAPASGGRAGTPSPHVTVVASVWSKRLRASASGHPDLARKRATPAGR